MSFGYCCSSHITIWWSFSCTCQCFGCDHHFSKARSQTSEDQSVPKPVNQSGAGLGVRIHGLTYHSTSVLLREHTELYIVTTFSSPNFPPGTTPNKALHGELGPNPRFVHALGVLEMFQNWRLVAVPQPFLAVGSGSSPIRLDLYTWSRGHQFSGALSQQLCRLPSIQLYISMADNWTPEGSLSLKAGHIPCDGEYLSIIIFNRPTDTTFPHPMYNKISHSSRNRTLGPPMCRAYKAVLRTSR